MSGQVHIDWLRITFVLAERAIPAFIAELSDVLRLPIDAIPKAGLHAFRKGLQLRAFANLRVYDFARLSYGGESQRGRVELDIPGASCALISDWVRLRTFAELLPEGRITRVDVACDLLAGEYTVEDALAWHQCDGFVTRGRKPVSRLDGDWVDAEEARTIYIGRVQNGKLLRVYEKGKQLGDAESPWVRFEVQFGNRDREIPLDVLTDPARYFAGAYEPLAVVLGAGGDAIRTGARKVETTLGAALRAMRQSYGRWLHALQSSGIEPLSIIEAVRITELPAKLAVSTEDNDVLAATIKAAFSEWGEPCR